MSFDYAKFELMTEGMRRTKFDNMTTEQRSFMFGLRRHYQAGKVKQGYRGMCRILLADHGIRLSPSCLHAFLHDDGTKYPEGKPDGKAKKQQRAVR